MYRKDNRVEIVNVPNDDVSNVNIQLQTSGSEPVAMSVTGADINLSYSSRLLNGITILDGSVVTWELANPFSSQVYISCVNGSAAPAVIQFLITGGIQFGKAIQ